MLIHLVKEKESRDRILYMVIMLAVAGLLAQIPVPGINSLFMAGFFAKAGVLTFMDSISGGALSNMTLAGFGVTSYITASIMVQLIMVAVPKLEMIRKDGEHGKRLFENIEIVIAMAVTFAGSLGLSISCGRNGLFTAFTPGHVIAAIACWMFGSFCIITLGKKADDYGIGNGISLILAFNILSRLPGSIPSFMEAVNADDGSIHPLPAILAILVVFGMIIMTIYLQEGVLEIPVKQARKSAAAINTDGKIPMGVGIANVLPVIYATTLMSAPALIIAFTGIETGEKADTVLGILNSSNWYVPQAAYQVIGLPVYLTLVTAFGFFASVLTFSPPEIADHMKKNGNVIPGVNPGADTVAFLEKRRKVLTGLNIVFLAVLTVLPDLFFTRAGFQNVAFTGTSMIIVVNVFYDTALRFRALCYSTKNDMGLFPQLTRKEALS